MFLLFREIIDETASAHSVVNKSKFINRGADFIIIITIRIIKLIILNEYFLSKL